MRRTSKFFIGFGLCAVGLSACADGSEDLLWPNDEGLPAGWEGDAGLGETGEASSEEGSVLVPDLPSFESGDDAGEAGGEGGTCLDLVFDWEPVRPQLMMVLDHSGSMGIGMEDGDGLWSTRWAVLHEVVRKTLERFDDEVEFGVKIFPTQISDTEGIYACWTSEELEADLGVGAGAQIMGAIPQPSSMGRGSTPMGAGLDVAAQALLAADDARPRVLLLVADGGTSASCGAFEGVQTIASRVEALRLDEGIETFVVGIDVDTGTATGLDTIAAAGGEGSWFAATEGAGLNAAIEGIVDALRSCSVDVQDGPAASMLAVRVGAEFIEGVDDCTGSDGYVYDEAGGELQLCGAACEAYLDGESLRVESFCQPG